MKYKLIITSLFLIIGFTGFSQDLKDANGDVIASIDSLGVLKDVSNYQIGQFMSNGDVLDMNGDVIGKIHGNKFKDMNNAFIGSINTSGEVVDLNSMKLGEVVESITIKDAYGNEIGVAASTVNNKWLAAFYFFYFNNY